MGGLLGKNKKKMSRNAEELAVISRLNQERNKLSMFRQNTELNLKSDIEQAKQLLREGRREEAKTLVKKKIYHERQLRSSNAQLDKIAQISNELELARSAVELSNFGESKIKRGKWKSIMKKKYKRQENYDPRKKLGKPVHGDIELQVLGVFNKKEIEKRNKIQEKTMKGIRKQKEIAELISGHLSMEDEKNVEKELEAIMNSGYQLPDIDQACKVGESQGSNDVTAINA